MATVGDVWAGIWKQEICPWRPATYKRRLLLENTGDNEKGPPWPSCLTTLPATAMHMSVDHQPLQVGDGGYILCTSSPQAHGS